MSVSAVSSPTRSEILFALVDNNKQVHLATFNGSSWSSSLTATTSSDQKDERPFDVTYESVTGRGMAAYWSSSAGHFAYRLWNGATWSSEVLMTGSSASASHYISLVAKPGSDDILLLAQDSNSSVRLLARVWDGVSWSNWAVLETSLPNKKYEAFAGAWERTSGRALVVYSESGQNTPRYRTWNGSTWSGEASAPTIGHNGRWFRLASDPGSNTIFMAAGDAGDDVEANVWNGTSWGSNTQFSNDTDSSNQRRFDLILEPGTNRPMCMYRVKNKNYPVYRLWNGSSWSSETSGPNINRKPVYFSLCQGSSSGEVFAGVQDDSGDLHLMRWSGSSWSSATEIETNIAGGSEPMRLVGASITIAKRRVISWTEEEPN